MREVGDGNTLVVILPTSGQVEVRWFRMSRECVSQAGQTYLLELELDVETLHSFWSLLGGDDGDFFT